jgi:hypothetical protein
MLAEPAERRVRSLPVTRRLIRLLAVVALVALAGMWACGRAARRLGDRRSAEAAPSVLGGAAAAAPAAAASRAAEPEAAAASLEAEPEAALGCTPLSATRLRRAAAKSPLGLNAVVVTFANRAQADFAQNWLAHVSDSRLSIHTVILAAAHTSTPNSRAAILATSYTSLHASSHTSLHAYSRAGARHVAGRGRAHRRNG